MMACCMARRKEKDDGDIFDDGDDAAVPQKDLSPPPDPLADDSHPQSDSQPQVPENRLSCTMLLRERSLRVSTKYVMSRLHLGML